jgi:hypothetical protein
VGKEKVEEKAAEVLVAFSAVGTTALFLNVDLEDVMAVQSPSHHFFNNVGDLPSQETGLPLPAPSLASASPPTPVFEVQSVTVCKVMIVGGSSMLFFGRHAEYVLHTRLMRHNGTRSRAVVVHAQRRYRQLLNLYEVLLERTRVAAAAASSRLTSPGHGVYGVRAAAVASYIDWRAAYSALRSVSFPEKTILSSLSSASSSSSSTLDGVVRKRRRKMQPFFDALVQHKLMHLPDVAEFFGIGE